MQRLLFFPGHRMLAYEWEAGAYRRVEAFEPNDDGLAAFRDWLAEAPRTPLQLLVDVIEEEFHVDRVPHVFGRERAQLLERTAQKHFRNTAFRYITRQERDATGRRDDRVLVAGLTNAQILQAWLDPIDEIGIPLKGIYSLPLVGEYLLPHLGAARSPDVLVVSQQVASTLRQSFYQGGRLRFSRLVPGRYSGTAELLTFLQEELERTIHFLEAQRFRRGDGPIQVYILVHGSVQAELAEGLRGIAGATIHLVALERLASDIGLRGELPGPYADALFGHLLLRRRWPENHYGLAHLRRNYRVERARGALWWVAAALVLAAVLVAGGAWLQGRAYDRGIAEARERTQRFERLYEQRLQKLDAFAYRAPDVKNAVDLMSQLAVALPQDPEPIMATVGSVLREHERIVLHTLRLQLSGSPETDLTASDDIAPAPAQLARLAFGDGPIHRHVLLRGTLTDFKGDYRRAKELFDRFLTALREHAALRGLRVVDAPFDLDPDSDISGRGATTEGEAAERAAFTVQLRYARPDAAE